MLTLVLGVNVLCGLALPLMLLPGSRGWLLLLAPLVLLTIPHWGLIHEAVHGHLHPRRPVNESLGRVLGVLFGAPFPVLRFGHLSHHNLNSRPAERADLYDPASTPPLRASVVYYLRLTAGLHLAELLSSLAFFLPRRRLAPAVRRIFYEGAGEPARRVAERAERQLLEPRQLASIRIDGGLALSWLTVCLWAYGVAWWWAWGLTLLGRAFVISFLDNAPHYAGEVDDPGQGHDMRAPRLVAPLILNTNLHGTHHRHPNLPWTGLPAAFAADSARYAGSYFLVPWRQLRGPIPLRAAPTRPTVVSTSRAA